MLWLWSGGISQVPKDCRGATPKCTAGKNQASFWAQQRCEEIKALRRVLCVILWQGKALSEALAGRNGYLLTHGADVLSHAGGSDPMRNRVIDFCAAGHMARVGFRAAFAASGL